MTKHSGRTLDAWLIRKDEEKIRDEHKENLSLRDLIDEFTSKIQIPELRDTNKVVYKLYELLPEGKRAVIVTEKAKVASAIARALGGGKKRTIKTNWGNVVSFELLWNSRYITIIPLRGHVVDYDVVEEYSGDWRNSDPRGIINPDSLRVIVKEKNIVDAIQRLSSNSDLLILATDADEEGANIGLEVFEIFAKVNKNFKTVQMWFISLDPKELRSAFLNPIEPKWSWAYAVKARRIIDAMIGFSATRELTLNFLDIIKRTGITKVISIGRVQTPTLYILYLREKEIESFKPKPYWVLYADINVGDKTFRAFHENSPFYDQSMANSIYNKLRDVTSGVISSVTKETKRIRPQPPLNTTRALILLNDVLGLNSKESMRILEDLYLNGLITYPRTETDKYPDNYNHARTLRNLLDYAPLSNVIREILEGGGKLRRNGSKLVGDHLPITPIATPNKNKSLTKRHLMVYDIIIRRYLALFMPDAEISRINILLNIGNENFKTTLSKIEALGFLIVYPYNKPKESLIELELRRNDTVQIKAIYPPEKKFTQPPSRLTEGSLISIMEKLGLGTKSTRPDHIETLVQRGYVKRKGKSLYVTKLGRSIISFLEEIWPDFVKPLFSARVYILMRKVMNNELEWRDMVNIIREEYLRLFSELRERVKDVSSRIHSAITEDILSSKVMDCPKCGSPMILKPTKSTKLKLLSCINCGYTLLVPSAKSYKVTDIKCAICGSNVLALKRPHRTLYLCPVCWREYGPCYKCPKRDECPISDVLKKEEEKYIVGKCSCGGDLIYFPEYRLIRCNKCGKKYYLPKKGSIKLLKKRCEKHNLRLFRIKEKNKSKYYCIMCATSK